MRIVTRESKAIDNIFKCYEKLNIDKETNDGKDKIYWLEFWYERTNQNEFIEHFKNIYDENVLLDLYRSYNAYNDAKKTFI